MVNTVAFGRGGNAAKLLADAMEGDGDGKTQEDDST